MGTAGGDDSVDFVVLGQEFDGIDQCFHRLYADVREIPHGGVDSRRCRVHDSAVGDDGVGEGFWEFRSQGF